MDSANDQYSIKNLLFTKAVPNYIIPVPTGGHKIFACTDCGDKFILPSSYDLHINRKSVKITYVCRHCNLIKIFYNRCNLLSHIRSHAFKTATINVGDLRLDPLPLRFFPKKSFNSPVSLLSTSQQPKPAIPQTKSTIEQPKPTTATKPQQTSEEVVFSQGNESLSCIECNAELPKEGTRNFEKRAKHYMQFTNETYTCPFCLFTLPTTCALKTHLRFHFKIPPYLCSECGEHLTKPHYPYDHKCEGFMMMRATVRIKCPAPSCHLLHPNDYKEHIKKNHMKKVFKCPYCFVACFDEMLMNNHLKNHNPQQLPIKSSVSFYQCELCPGKIIQRTDIHFKSHSPRNYVFPCWVCAKVFKDVYTLGTHHLNDHDIQDSIRTCFEQLLNVQKKTILKKKVYRVVKRCDQCERSFSYNCNLEQIPMLPNECPYKCTVTSGPESDLPLTCHICKNKISQNWEDIKKHFYEFHKEHRCVDVKVMVSKINIDKYLSAKEIIKTRIPSVRKSCVSKKLRRKRVQKKASADISIKENLNEMGTSNITGEFVCKICGQQNENKEFLEKHLLTHRDPCMAYQCMECGQSFVVKPSFSKHLLLVHEISDFENYIIQKQCYNEAALQKYQNSSESTEPLRENQCKICREQFGNSDDLEKHFRVHGMAFLMKNNCNKTVSP